MRGNEWQCFFLVVFTFCSYKESLSKSVIVTDTVNPLEQLSRCWNDFSANVNH